MSLAGVWRMVSVPPSASLSHVGLGAAPVLAVFGNSGAVAGPAAGIGRGIEPGDPQLQLAALAARHAKVEPLEEVRNCGPCGSPGCAVAPSTERTSMLPESKAAVIWMSVHFTWIVSPEMSGEALEQRFGQFCRAKLGIGQRRCCAHGEAGLPSHSALPLGALADRHRQQRLDLFGRRAGQVEPDAKPDARAIAAGRSADADRNRAACARRAEAARSIRKAATCALDAPAPASL